MTEREIRSIDDKLVEIAQALADADADDKFRDLPSAY
jgi:hypothetical protein